MHFVARNVATVELDSTFATVAHPDVAVKVVCRALTYMFIKSGSAQGGFFSTTGAV